MEKQLKCVLLLTLKEMALRRVVVLLCSGPDIFASIKKYRLSELYYESLKKWQAINGDKIKGRMAKLELPETLTEPMIDLVQPISLEIKRWKHIHECFFSSSETIGLFDSVNLCWTTAGAIDYRKTAEGLVGCDMLDVEQRYKLACYYCLEDHIPRIWEELSEEMKDHFYKQKPSKGDLTFFWPHILRGELSKLDYLWRTSSRNLTTFNQYAFKHSAKNCLKSAAEYFFQKLTQEERAACLMRTANAVVANLGKSKYEYREDYPNERISSVLRYLLTLMTPEQQMETAKARPIYFFLCFLDWPMQDLFLENADLIWTTLPPISYRRLLREMAVTLKKPDCYFPKLFQEFFMQSPLDFKKCFVDLEEYYVPAVAFLRIFFDYKDSDSVKVVFRNVDAADRVELLFHHRALHLLYAGMMLSKMSMVELCLREAALSEEERQRLKKAFNSYLIRIDKGQIKWGIPNFRRFNDLLDATDARACEEKKPMKRKRKSCEIL